jgi:chitodextrinase
VVPVGSSPFRSVLFARIMLRRGLSGVALALALIVATLPLSPHASADPPLFSDGFESGDLSAWTTSAGLTVQGSEIYAGSFAARGTTTNGLTWAAKNLAATQTNIYYQAAVKLISQTTNVGMLRFQTNGPITNILTLFVNSTGKLAFRNDTTGVTRVSATSFTTGIWRTVKVHVVINGASSQVEVWLDGVKVNDLSITQSLGTTPVGRLMLGDNAAARTYDIVFDEVVASGPDTTPPSTPTNLHTTSVTSTQVDLAWDPSTDDVGVTVYEVYRGGQFLASTGGSQTNYSDTSVLPATTYEYTVRAGDGANNFSPQSDPPLQVTTDPQGGPLFSDGFESGDLSAWTTSAGLTVQGSEIYAGSFAARGTTTNGLTWAAKNLAATQTNIYYQAAVKLISQTTNVGMLRFQTNGPITNILTLFVNSTGKLAFRNDTTGVTRVSATSFTTGIWRTVKVHVVINGASSQVEVWLDGVKVNDLSITQSLGTTPVGRLMLGDNAAARTYDIVFDEVVASGPDTTPPSTPTNLHTTSVTSTQVDLAWDPSTDDVGVTVYEVYRGGQFLASTGGSQTNYSDTSVLPATTYEYTVRAGDGANNFSPQSAPPLQVTTSPPGSGDTLAANAFPIWQTNGIVWAMAYANGAVYVGGEFTSVRPPGAPPGTGEVARNRIAAFSSTTGELLPFQHDMNSIVWELEASPDGTRVYAGGDFTTVDGQARSRLASFDTSTGALTTWAPSAWARVLAIAPTSTTVYIGGSFTTFNGQPRERLAAVDQSGALLPWAPTADGSVDELAVAGGGTRVIAGGYFATLNGQSFHRIGSLDPASGALEAWAYQAPPICGGGDTDVKAIIAVGDIVYVGAEGTGGGCFDGTFAANASDGTLVWLDHCLGATQGIAAVGSHLYVGSHAHNCSAVGGVHAFPERWPNGLHLLAESLDDGEIQHWFPNTNGQPLGPRVMATDGLRLWVGGDFTTVNNQPQQGMARFEFGPDTTRPVKPAPPSGSSCQPGKISVTWRATTDLDDHDLTYRVFRDGDLTNPVHTVVASSEIWFQPVLSFQDTGLAPGSTHTYRVDASDGTNVSFKSNASASITVATGAGSPYSSAVLADTPMLYWRLGDTSGTTALDCAGGRNGIYRTGITLNQTGALVGDGDKAVQANGNSDGYVVSSDVFSNPQVFSIEFWFKSTDTTGGKLVGFGNAQSGNSSNYDRHVYMQNNGRLRFGVWTGSAQTIETPTSYRDSTWHHVVATLSGNGLKLYVDGVLRGTNPTTFAQAYDGYWRLGGDSLGGWPSQPSGAYINTTLDEFAVYSYELSAAQVANHYDLGT